MKIELLLDAPEFWARLRDDIAGARRRAWVQTFTFEGDRVGVALARALHTSRAPDRRLLVDEYSRLYHSDRLIPGPALFDRRFRREVALTHRWVRRLRQGGASVTFGKPLGPTPVRLARRSHKKVACVDDHIVYLGGINFSEHNFAWHDMMLRVESPALAAIMARDFEGAFEGRSKGFDTTIGPLRVVSMSGRGNRARFRPVLRAVRSARHSIDIASPYLSYPFTIYLAQAVSRGVRVRVLMPDTNNKSNLARHIIERAARGGFEVLRYRGGMSHMKAMVIDDELLVTGSSNFDFMSYHVLEEHVVMSKDAELLRQFRTRIWNPDVASAKAIPVRSSPGTRLADAGVRLGAALAASLALEES